MTLQYWAKIENERRDQNNGAWLMALTFPPKRKKAKAGSAALGAHERNLRNEFQIKIHPTLLIFFVSSFN